MKRLKGWLVRHIPRLSRPQRIVRNFGCIVLMLLCAWFMVGAPALTVRWAFRRAERLNLMNPSEILDVADVGKTGKIVVAESEDSYILYYDMPRYKKYQIPQYEETWLSFDEKTSPVTLMMPMWHRWGIIEVVPWVLMTDLPVARGEVEFTLIPDISDQYIEEEVHYLVEGELLESGNLLFEIDSALAEYKKGEKRWAESDVQITLDYLSMARYHIQHTCTVDIAVRLWDETGNLIYDEILRNGVEVIEDEN